MAKMRNSSTLPRALRQRSTGSEIELCRLFRSRRLAHLKWRRQVPLGAYIVDFLCYGHRLNVECDGAQHTDSARNLIRDAWLQEQGFSVVRFWNHEILQTPLSVTGTILAKAGLPF